PLHEVRQGFAVFPQPAVHAAFAALAEVDSVTVDPHKLGYLPYGAGAFVCRDQRALPLLPQAADYVFRPGAAGDSAGGYRQLGQLVRDGSKSGAMAAAVYVSHRVLPLDHANFGLLPRQTVLAAEAFRARAQRFSAEMAGTLA